MPSLMIASSEFEQAAQAQATSLGIDPAAIFVPHPIQDRTDEEMRVLADQALPKILQALQSVS